MLSERLLKIINFVTPGNTLVDIGCDHAYMDIELINRGIVPYIVACDIGKGPLKNAEKNIKNAGFSDKIETRISDGLSNVRMLEGETLVIAGLGGNTIIDILENEHAVASSFAEIILEPQSDQYKLRKFLYEKDFFLIDEDMVCESNKYYPILKVATKKGLLQKGIDNIKLLHNKLPILEMSDLDIADLMYGPYLIKTKNECLYDFLNKELFRLQEIYNKCFLITSTKSFDNINMIREKIEVVQSALANIQMGVCNYEY